MSSDVGSTILDFIRSIKLVLLGTAGLIIFGIMSSGEIDYLLYGKTAQAELVSKQDRFQKKQTVFDLMEYRFKEESGLERRCMHVQKASVPVLEKVTVQYTPGASGQSRILNDNTISWLWLGLFGLSIILFLFSLVSLKKFIVETFFLKDHAANDVLADEARQSGTTFE
ncbi:MAG: hypothetical protein QM703_11685 [Gemmatales bacterium]